MPSFFYEWGEWGIPSHLIENKEGISLFMKNENLMGYNSHEKPDVYVLLSETIKARE